MRRWGASLLQADRLSASTKQAAETRFRSSSCTASAPTNRCGRRSSRISANLAARWPSTIPAMATAIPRLTGTTRDDYAAAILAAMDALGIDRAHICGLSLGGVIAIAIHHAAPERCASLILADTFAVHPDGQGIYDRSVAGSADMRAFAEARADFLLAQPADPAVRSEVIETMSRIDPAGLLHRRRGGVACRPARPRWRDRACRR